MEQFTNISTLIGGVQISSTLLSVNKYDCSNTTATPIHGRKLSIKKDRRAAIALLSSPTSPHACYQDTDDWHRRYKKFRYNYNFKIHYSYQILI